MEDRSCLIPKWLPKRNSRFLVLYSQRCLAICLTSHRSPACNPAEKSSFTFGVERATAHMGDRSFAPTLKSKLLDCVKYSSLKNNKKKNRVVRWDLEEPISSGYLAHCSHPFFISIRIEFSASYCMLSQRLVTSTLLAKLFINPEFCQCPLRRSCQLQLF